ncbi:MAG TPA: hypothetical protein VFJ02_19755 [Vicinamibacterales bacterium]|nr:hypothetical protein [Vicinamibacterales bacterium]
MRTVECSREQDVVDALATGRWPARIADELRQHVASCQICRDTLAVAGAILAEPDTFSADARVPSSAVMWWRAQMRAKQEAAREAARPVNVAQTVGAICAIALAVAFVVMFSPLVRGWAVNTIDSLTGDIARVGLQAALLTQGWLMPALLAGLWLLITPLAIYFALAED